MSPTNLLIDERSPYLLQHAHNPVDWYPWGDIALEKSRLENKPILLSIGYTACHWCHVMAHESFEDQETAALMNKLFVSVKVDKEERPDLDKVYQMSHYLLNRQAGGWPLNVFLTPDLVPFFSGTYFPKEARYQLPSFKKLLQTIADLYKIKSIEITNQGIELKRILQQHNHDASNVILNNHPLEQALDLLQQRYDPIYGGFEEAPKFPHPSKLEYLLKKKSPMASSTLLNMAKGGIYDQLGGGFYRYAVDQKWRIPHFEKMLYDNGQLLALYAMAYQDYDEPYFYDIAKETAEWVMNEMQSPEGGYYSSLDADSEGEEGRFYVWDKLEIQSLLSQDEYAVIRVYYGLELAPNFEGHWHLYVAQSMKASSEFLAMTGLKTKKLLVSAKKKLLMKRCQRPSPFRDEKILTSWNALMIKGMLLAGKYLNEPRFIGSAQQSLAFIKKNLWSNQHLSACFKDGDAYLGAYLDDYAFLLDALLTSLQVSWNTDDLLFAIAIADNILNDFCDRESGGFFFTATGSEALLYRPKTMMDEAIPSGNAVLARALLTLGHLLGEARYLAAAEKTLQAAWSGLKQFPAEHCTLLLGLKEYLYPSPIIVLRGDKESLKIWKDCSKSINNCLFVIPKSALNLPESIASKKPKGAVGAYVCQGTHCESVIEDLDVFKSFINKLSVRYDF